MLKIYCARPINGCTIEDVRAYYEKLSKRLSRHGFIVLTPMSENEYIRVEAHFKAEGNGNPVSTNKIIQRRDRWLVKNSDVVYVNLIGAKTISIGCMMELAWAFDNGKHTIVVMEPNNIHRHAFVIESSDAIFETEEQAMNYLKVVKNHFGG